jgi:hypothetical protein
MSDPIITRIAERARLFVEDNFTNPTPSDYLIIQNAMLIGSSIAFEIQAEKTYDTGQD